MLKFASSINTSEKEGDGERPAKKLAGGFRAVLRRRKHERERSEHQVMPEINLNLRQPSALQGQSTEKPNPAHFRTNSVTD